MKLAQSSFCWGMVCADFVPYRCGDKDVPVIRVARGARVTLRFGFVPTSVSVGAGRRMFKLPARQWTVWRARYAGDLYVFATARRGDTTYIGCIRRP